jgi:polysaccharide export outer membrane protein
MYRSVICACLLALGLATGLAACGDLHGDDVVAQANADGKIAFDVVKIDDAVIRTVLADQPPPFRSRFKPYIPPPELKMALGDTVSVVIWESSDGGLFGNSLTELSFPGGAAALARGSNTTTPLGGVPAAPGGLAVSPDLMMSLFGGAQNSSQTQSSSQSQTQSQAEPGNTNNETNPARRDSSSISTSALAGATSLFGNNDTETAANSRTSRRRGPETTRSQDVERLLDMAEQSGRPGTRIPDQQIGPDGSISVPYAGRVMALGRTPAQVQHTIEKALSGKALDPQVLVVVKKSPANAVSVAGEVVGGARVPLSPGGDRLLQVIAAAGGAKAPLHETFVRLSRNGVTASAPLATLVSDPAQDIYAEPGDVLTLIRRPQTFTVFGATGKNTAVSFSSDHLSLTEALAKAGGLLDNRADPRAVFLFRYEPIRLVKALGQPIAPDAPPGLAPVVYRLDLMEGQSYLLAQRFPVHDKDVIFVANSRYQEVYAFAKALSQVAGPVETGLLTCHYSANC